MHAFYYASLYDGCIDRTSVGRCMKAARLRPALPLFGS